MREGVTTTGQFDALKHHRQRTRRAEARADMLERENEQLRRLLIIVLERAFQDTPVDPIQYLHHLVDTDLICRDLGLDHIAIQRLTA